MVDHDEMVVCAKMDSVHHFFNNEGWYTLDCDRFLPASKVSFESAINGTMKDRNPLRPEHATYHSEPIFLPRSQAEISDKYKHLITYTVINSRNHVVSYRRGKSGGESRLHAFRSIGIGGHVTAEDIKDGLTPAALHAAAMRELDEEVIHSNGDIVYMGMLSDDSSPVNRVHLGLVFEFRTNGEVYSHEGCLEDLTFDGQYSLTKAPDGQFESWSEILIRNVLRPPLSTFFA